MAMLQNKQLRLAVVIWPLPGETTGADLLTGGDISDKSNC